jgi:hypothetical protein
MAITQTFGLTGRRKQVHNGEGGGRKGGRERGWLMWLYSYSTQKNLNGSRQGISLFHVSIIPGFPTMFTIHNV